MFKRLTISLVSLSLLLTSLTVKTQPIYAADKQELDIAVVTTDANNDLYKTLVDNYDGITLCDSIDKAIALNSDSDTNNDVKGIMVLADTYPNQTTVLTTEQSEAIKASNVRLYIEYPENNDTLGISGYSGTNVMSYNRMVVTDKDAMNMDLYSLLYVSGAKYVKKAFDASKVGSADNNVWAVCAKIAGYDVSAFQLKNTSPYVLLEENGNVLVATTKFSQWISARYSPYERYQEFWSSILTWLTKSDTRVEKMEWALAVHAAHKPEESLNTNDYLNAIKANSDWYFNSGFLLSDTDAEAYKSLGKYGTQAYDLNPDTTSDGSNGVIETFSSGAAFQTDGSQTIRFIRRADCTGESAGALAMAYYSTGDVRYKEAAYNLVNWLFNESSLANGKRSDPTNADYGLLDWDDAANTPEQYYGDDNAKAILGLICAVAVLGEDGKQFEQRLLEAITANFRLTGELGFRSSNISSSNLQNNGWEYYYNRTNVTNYRPHHEALLMACYLWAYEQTGWKPFLERTKKGIQLMMEAYENTMDPSHTNNNEEWYWMNGLQQERSKMILPLAWLVKLEPTETHETWLYTMISDMMATQSENTYGGIQDAVGTAGQGKGSYGSFTSNSQYGTREAPIIQQNGDPCVDNLYTQGFAMLGLNEAVTATSNATYKAKYAAYYDNLTDFLVKSQQVSDVYPEFDGVWFRGFDYEKWETYGSDGDHEWGVWSTETGWTQSWISAGISMNITDTNIWDLSASLDFKDDFEVIKEVMLSSLIANEGNIASNKTVSDNTKVNAALAVDGSLETVWEIDTTEEDSEMVIDLEGTYDVSSINVVANYKDGSYTIFNVYTSSDKETWNLVGKQESITAAKEAGYTFTLEDNTTRYIKVEPIVSSTGNSIKILEVRAYGEKTSNDLEDLIISVEAKNLDAYTKDSVDALKEALQEAKEVANNSEASADEIASATSALESALEALKLVSADYEITFNPTLQTSATNGNASLMDGIYGTILDDRNFDDGQWMGVETKDITIVIDMKEIQYLDSMILGVLQEYPWSIRFPEYVQFSTSLDNITYTDLDVVGVYEEFKEGASLKYDVETIEKETAARYIKIFVKNGGSYIRDGKTFNTWVFMDELTLHYTEDSLQALVDSTEALDTSSYTDSAVEVLKNALNNAKEVLNKTNASDTEIENAITSLEKAIKDLENASSTPTIKYSVKPTYDVIMDGVYGSFEAGNSQNQIFPNGTWGGINNNDLQVDIDLKEVKTFNQLSLGFLNECKRYGIAYPDSIEFSISTDGSTYTVFDTVDLTGVSENKKIESYRAITKAGLADVQARYVRIKVKKSSAEWFFFDEFKYDSVYSPDYQYTRLANGAHKVDSGSGTILMDGKDGTLTQSSSKQIFNNGTWAGVDRSSLQIDVDLKEEKEISELSLGFLSETAPGIYYPDSVKYEVSTDGTNYTTFGTVDLTGISDSTGSVHKAICTNVATNARYIRVTVTKSSGQWFFFDELKYSHEPTITYTRLANNAHKVDSGDGNVLLDGMDGALALSSSNQTFNNGTWAGINGSSLQIDVDFKENKEFTQLSMGFLNEKAPSIYFPDAVKYEVSTDGVNYTTFGTVDVTGVSESDKSSVYKAVCNGDLTSARYIRVTVTKSSGQWFFFDELACKVTVDKTQLQNLVEECKKVDQSLYLDSSLVEFRSALANAKVILTDEGVTYEEVNEATDALKDAKNALVTKKPEITASSALGNGTIDKILDGIFGSLKKDSTDRVFPNGTWAGIEDKDLVVTINLKEAKTFNAMTLGFLEEWITGIRIPEYVIFNTSLTPEFDDANAEKIMINDEFNSDEAPNKYLVESPIKNRTAQYVQITIKNAGHYSKYGADTKSWFFFDEFTYDTVRINKAGLNSVIKDADSLVKEEFSVNTYSALENALLEAKDVKADTTATQSKVDTITQKLQKAMDELVDISKLNTLVKQFDNVDKDVYTPNSYNDYKDSAAIAKEILAKVDATQDEVDEAAEALEKGFAELLAKANTSALIDQLEEVETFDANDYTEASMESLEAAVEKAEEVLADENATQAMVDEALANVEAAKDALVNVETLKEALEIVKGIDTSKYTEESVKALKEAIKIAEEVLIEGRVEEVADAKKALSDTYTALEEKEESVPPTGDTTNVGGLLTVMIAALGVLLASRRKRV